MKFLGHAASNEKVKLDPDKVIASCKKEGRRLMSVVNYLNKFCEKLAEYSAPICNVIESKAERLWGYHQQKAFKRIKTESCNSPVLCTFDIDSSHRVSADPSKNAIGAVLIQCNESNQWQPVKYASRKLTETERRCAIDRERGTCNNLGL